MKPRFFLRLFMIWTLSAIMVVSAAASVTSSDALKTALPDGFGGKRVWVTPTMVRSGSPIETVKGTIGYTPADGWLIFSDDNAFANWEHPARYLFVDGRTGELYKYNVTVPPPDELLQSWVEMTPETRDLIIHANGPSDTGFEMVKSVLPGKSQKGGSCYAVLISGGASKSNNHIRYWNDLSNVYKGLTGYYGYPDENIIVLCSDGLDPSPDRSDGTNSPPDLDDDGDDDINFPATKQYIDQTFSMLSNILQPEDMLFVFTTDHGGSNGGWDAYLNLWNWDEMTDSYFQSLIDALPQCTMVFTMEQCYSGGFEDNLANGRPNRIFSSACRYNQVSWAMPPSYDYDTYVFHWTAAVRWVDAYGHSVDADTDEDGLVNMIEAFEYAKTNDSSSENPQYDEFPAGLGAQTTLFGTMSLGYIEGYVRDSDSGVGIDDASVWIPGTAYSTETESDGSYWMFAPAGEEIEVHASAFGYLEGSTSLIIPEGETVDLDFNLDIAPSGEIEGYVNDNFGEPVNNAEIRILNTPIEAVHSGTDGYYHFQQVPEGTGYVLRASEISHVPETENASVFAGQTTRLDFNLAEGFSSDMETGAQGWTHYSIKASYSDQWHLEDYRNHTTAGSWSWKLGGDNGSDYGARVDGGLESPALDLGYAPTLSFYHWIDCAVVNRWSSYDGGIVEIRVPGGDWTQIEPEGGYPYSIFYNLFNPFPAGTPCFAGSHDWQMETFDLSDYAWTNGVKIRFHFGSGTMNDGEGWYIDDVLVTSGKPASISVTPESASLSRGDELEVSVKVENLSEETETMKIYSELILPGGSSYPGNPLDGPVTVEIQAGASGQTTVTHLIPAGAPLGVYSYIWKVETPPGSLVDRDMVTLEVTE